MTELYGALEGDLLTLAAIGVRTCFDVAAGLLKIDPSITFAQKLDKLVEAGHIGMLDRSRLATLVDAGSASAHRGWRPSSADVETMTDALEHFIHSAFVAPEEQNLLNAKLAKVKNNVPMRSKPHAATEDSSGLM
ncbi:MAG: DUF4145 domain-containing protein [Pyrinomonadaceae bacterium]